MQFTRSTLVLLAVLSLALPAITAQADTDMGGDVDIPAPRETKQPPFEPMEKPVTAIAPPHLMLTSTSVAAGIGLSWGEGTLRFEGVDRAFSVRGLSLLDIGVSVTEGLGEVYNLTHLEDFEGTYVAVEAAGAVGTGASTTRMRNAKGVEIELRSDLRGAQLALATQGVSISFK